MNALGLSKDFWIVGHRGAAGEVLENTLTAMERGAAAGADMLELDVQMTRDGKLVCFHDWSFERLAGVPEAIEERSWRFVTDVELRRPEAGAGARVPSLAQVLAERPASLPLNLEIKRRIADRRLLAERVAGELGGHAGILVSSFDWKLLQTLRERGSALPLAPIGRYQRAPLVRAGRELGAYSLHCHRRLAGRRLVGAARAAGIDRVLAYTVNDPSEAAELEKNGLAGIFTDVPSRLVAARSPADGPKLEGARA